MRCDAEALALADRYSNIRGPKHGMTAKKRSPVQQTSSPL